MLHALWNRYYHPGVTGSFHGDMARAFQAILQDSDCDRKTHDKIQRSVREHRAVENSVLYKGTKWFCEVFPKGI